MSEVLRSDALPPLRFEPLFQYRLWGGRRLGDWMDATLPEGPVCEAWILSDREGHANVVAEGPHKGTTITDLIRTFEKEIMGRLAGRFDRFPLLLKFLDVEKMLSVQVHPRDDQLEMIPAGERGKTESWIVLEARPGSRIFAGLKPGTTANDLRSLTIDSADDHIASLAPEVGQGLLITAGTVHSLGDGVVVFEVQENSDITFRLFDWDHVDEKSGRKRDLQVEQALRCIDLDQGAITPVGPQVVVDGSAEREAYVRDSHFEVRRFEGSAAFSVGAANEPRVVVCIGGEGRVGEPAVAMRRGSVVLLPASLGPVRFTPGTDVTLLEIAIPDAA